MRRHRVPYASSLLAVIMLGLASRAYSPPLPSFVKAYVGDALWALAAYLTVALLFPRLPIRWVAVTAGLFSLTVELSQLYRAAWIDGLRQLRSAALLLGHGFLWSDLVCYGVGIGAGVCAEALSSSLTDRASELGFTRTFDDHSDAGNERGPSNLKKARRR